MDLITVLMLSGAIIVHSITIMHMSFRISKLHKEVIDLKYPDPFIDLIDWTDPEVWRHAAGEQDR